MAALAVHVNNKETEKISVEKEFCATHSQKITEIDVAESSKNIEVSLMKEFLSNDSGILTYENNRDVSNLIMEKEKEKEHSIEHFQCIQENLAEHSSIAEEQQFQKEIYQFSIDNKRLKENRGTSNFIDCNLNSLYKKNESILRNCDENSNSDYTIKESQNINKKNTSSPACVSNSFLSIKTSQISIDTSKESNSKSNLQCSNTQSLIERQNQQINIDLIEDNDNCLSVINSYTKSMTKNQSLMDNLNDENNSKSASMSSINENSSKNQIKSKSVNNDLTTDSNFQSSIISSNYKSTTKRSQSVTDKSNESNSRSNFKSSNTSLPERENQSVNTDLVEDNDSCSTILNSASKSTNGKHQSTIDKSNNESNSKSSFKSSSRSSPEKQNQSENTFQQNQSINKDFSEDNDSCSTILSSSKSTNGKRQSTSDKSDNESNSKSSFKSSSRSSPEKQNQSKNTFQQNQSENTFQQNQSINKDLSEDNDSCSTILSSSISTNGKRQSTIDKSDNESNSKSSFKSSSKSSPEKQSQSDTDFKKSQNDTSNSNSNSKLATNEITPEKQKKDIKAKSKKYLTIIDSDSEDEMIIGKHNHLNIIAPESQSSNSARKLQMKSKRKYNNSDSEEELIESSKISENLQRDFVQNESDIEIENFKLSNKSNKISNLIDSDSESDNDQLSKSGSCDSSGETNDIRKHKKERKKLEKKRTGSARASKESAMQQIHSETQRLIRESEISLPYHRPKQRTLQEFLNRKKITSEIPKNLTCAEKVKMFPEMISKVVEEKEKEAEIFYKSSDSEEDEKSSEIMEVDQVNVKNQNKDIIRTVNEDENDNKINIADTQKLTQDEIQESHNKREILQQRSLDHRVARKLFMEDLNDIKKTENIQVSQKCINKEEILNSSLVAFKKKYKEVKTGLRESSISRKLFTSDTEDVDMDIDNNNSDNDESMLKEQVKENQKLVENYENKSSSEDKIIIENSTEEIVLNISETELDSSENKKVMESSIIGDSSIQSKDQENLIISETPFISNKEISKSNRVSIVGVSNENVESEIVNTEESKELEDAIVKLNSNKVEIVDNSVLECDFSLPFDESSKKSSMKEKILANVLKIKPTIKGSPGSIIDFANSGEMKQGVTRLLDRFARHSIVIKPKAEEISEVKILRTEGVGNDIKIVEETLPFKKTVVDAEDQKEHKPGEKLKKLREDLKRKIATVRNEEWKQKEEFEKEDNEEEFKFKGDDFYADLPDEEELLEDEESSESEPEENDVLIVDKPKSSCQFADEEAEESDNEYVEDIALNENDDEEENEEEDSEENNEEDDDDDEDDIGIDDNEESKENEYRKSEIEDKKCNEPRKLKRIVKAFEEESNQSESSLSNDANARLSFDRTKTDEDMFASQTSNSYASEDIEAYAIPPFQPRERCGSDSRSQICKTPLLKPNNILSMISPVAQLTALNASLDSAKKSASKTNNIHFGQIDNFRSVGNTPANNSNRPQNSCNLEKMISLPKKLFEDPPETVNDDELLDICSGKFTETQNSESMVNNKQDKITDTQLMELCSGVFVSQPIDMKKLESADSNLHLSEETSQDITLTLDDDENDDLTDCSAKMSSSMKRSDESMFSSDSKSPVKPLTRTGTTIKNPMEAWLKRANEKQTSHVQQQKRDEVTESQLIGLCSGSFTSQPIDMRELEHNETTQNQNEVSQNFGLSANNNSESLNKKSAETNTKVLKSSKQAIVDAESESKVPWGAYTILCSDDEDEKKDTKKKTRAKKKGFRRKKVQALKLSDDEDDKQDEYSEEEEIEIDEEDEEKYIDYDSDENEIVIVNKKEIKKVAEKFLEDEAELSESDWDSADEDEQDMDKLEYEEGDGEEIDEYKIKKQLDKIHVKQMLDEDHREVKMLQELLFDDGDLHSEGAGRERKFKWKNIDNFEEDDLKPRTEDDDEIEDEVDTALELQMRKIRHAQQKFLEEKEKNIDKDVEQEFDESHLHNLGLKVVSIRSSTKSSLETSKINITHSSINKNYLMLNGISNLTSKTVTSSKSVSFTNMRGSFLSRGDESLVRIAQNLPEKNKQVINPSRTRNFVFEHLSPSVSKIPEQDVEQENENTPTREKKKARKRKMFLSQTPKTTKKLKIDDRTGRKLF